MPDLRKIVVFGSSCSVYRDPNKNLLKQRPQLATIVGVNEETKGYKVYLRKENKVIVTQYVKNIDTLSEAQNAQLQRAMVDEDEDVAAHDSRSATTTDTSNVTSIKARKKNKKK